MDIKDLKKMLKNSTSVLILDNGEPSFVIMDYSVYRNVLDLDKEQEVKIVHAVEESKAGRMDTREAEILERLNKEILALKNQIEMEEKKELSLQE